MATDDPTAWPLGNWVHRHAENHPERTALIFERQELSYAALADRIDRFAHGLDRELGLKP
ncbi:MAG: AMP-binding protein, partial [Geminicoccaceae bacterium]